MPLNLPKSEAHYVTREGDVIDAICWAYYQFTTSATEQTFARNSQLLSRFGAILPAGLIIVLPVVADPTIDATTKLWNYRLPEVVAQAQIEYNRLLAAKMALAQYRTLRGAAQKAGTFSPSLSDSVVDLTNPALLTETDYLAAYYQDSDGKWKIARINKSNVQLGVDGYAQRIVALESFKGMFEGLGFAPNGSASLVINIGEATVVFDPTKFTPTASQIMAQLNLPVATIQTCQGDVDVLGPLPSV